MLRYVEKFFVISWIIAENEITQCFFFRAQQIPRFRNVIVEEKH